MIILIDIAFFLLVITAWLYLLDKFIKEKRRK